MPSHSEGHSSELHLQGQFLGTQCFPVQFLIARKGFEEFHQLVWRFPANVLNCNKCEILQLAVAPLPVSSVLTRRVSLCVSLRGIRGDDDVLPPEEEDWLLCDSDVPAMHHDRHTVSSLLLAEQRVRSRPHRVRWVSPRASAATTPPPQKKDGWIKNGCIQVRRCHGAFPR